MTNVGAIRAVNDAMDSDDDVKYNVIDLNATQTAREHELMNGNGKIKKFRFKDNYTAARVPFDYAIRLIGNDGFEVRDENGNLLELEFSEVEVPGVILRVDQVIASYDELTTSALKARSEKIDPEFKTNKKDEVIAFLISNRDAEYAVNKTGGGAEEAELLDLEEDEDVYA